MQRWLNPAEANAGEFASLDQRIQLDVQDLIKLVAAASVDWPGDWARDLIADLRPIGDGNQPDRCGQLGQLLISRADQVAWPGGQPDAINHHRRWRTRLARWLTGKP
jgi:hypothetical protein